MNFQKLSTLYFGPYMWFKRIVFGRIQIKHVEGFVKNKKMLTAEQKRAIRRFYAPYRKVNPICHTYYLEKTGNFSELYIPSDLFYNYIDEFYNDRYGARTMDNKCLYPKYFKDIPQAETILYRSNGCWINSADQLLSASESSNLINNESAVFVKVATTSAGGHGVFYIEADGEDLYAKLMDTIKNISTDIVVQRPLKQHSALAALNPSSVNTIRVLSLLSPEGVKIYSTVLRMGIGNTKVDNASSGGVTCGIDDTGKLKKTGYKPSGEKYDVHPSSGIVFEGYAIPEMDKVWELARRAHINVPHYRMVSWDFAIDVDGQPVLIEANLNQGELDFHQLNNGPLFGDDTIKVLNEVFGKS